MGPAPTADFLFFLLQPRILRWLAAVLPQFDRRFTALFSLFLLFLFYLSLPFPTRLKQLVQQAKLKRRAGD
jgi:hypothetical protein